MDKTTGTIKPEYIIEIILRRKWFIIVPFCISMIVGIYLALTLPKIYRSSTLILVQPQTVPTGYVRSIVSTNIESRLRTISQQIMSRTNIDRIIKTFGLFEGPQYEKMFLEDKIAGIRKRIGVNVSRTNTFTISFKGKEPRKVMRIANALASYFIDENLKVREAQAIGTSDFLEDELNTMKKRLIDREEALRIYREDNFGSLPEQLETNLRILDNMQKQVATKQENLINAKNMLVMFDRQIAEAQSMQSNFLTFEEDDTFDFETDEETSQIDKLKELLNQLKINKGYTDKHPDVKRLKNIIANREEAEAKAMEEENAANEETEVDQLEIEVEQPEANYQDMQKARRNEIIKQIKKLENDIVKIDRKIKLYQKRVEETPKKEQELLSIKRDYSNIKNIYDSLLNRKLEAEISVNMEKKQKGEQFLILDPAIVSEKPIAPDMNQLFILSIVAGLGLGGGIIFLLEYLNTSFRQLEDIEAVLGLPIIAAIPIIHHRRDRIIERLKQILSIIAVIFSAVLLTIFSVLTTKGVDKTIEFVKKFITI